MKTMSCFVAALILSTSGFSQQGIPYPKTIAVTGSAEMEVIPDEIHVQVDLQEYEKKGQGKVGLDKIKHDFLLNLKAAGIHDSLVSIAGYGNYNPNPWLRKKNKKDELYASVSYLVKLKSSDQMDALVERLDDYATQNFFIQQTAHSKMQEYRKQLKMEAVKAAKAKAIYLAESIDEKISVAVTINEPSEHFTPYAMEKSNVIVRETGRDMQAGMPSVDFRKIKLKYDVMVVFALK